MAAILVRRHWECPSTRFRGHLDRRWSVPCSMVQPGHDGE